MHFQRQKKYHYHPQNFLSQNYQAQNPRTNNYNRDIQYRAQTDSSHNKIPSSEMLDSDKQMEMSNQEINPQVMYNSRSIIRSIKDNINDKYTPSQLVGDRPLSSALHNFSSRFGEEREPSPKTINIGDTRESIEYNIRTLNARKSPRYYEEFNAPQEMNYIDSNDSEVRNGSFEGRRYYGNNMSYNEKGINNNTNRFNDNNIQMNLFDRNGVIYGNIYNGPPGGRIALGGETSPYKNFDEMNTSNENERAGSEERKNRTFIGNNTYDYRQNRFGNVNMLQNRTLNVNNMNNLNNMNNPNNLVNYNNLNNYNNVTNMNNTNVNMTEIPVNTISMPKDEIQEKYANKTYDNMTYKDVKKIVRRFTKVYDPNKNNNGLLVEESQVTLPGANDEIFNNRYRVLTKMNRLSTILLSKQRRPSPQREDDLFFNSEEMSGENSDEYNIRTHKSFNRQSFEKRSKSPIKLPNRKSPENKFKYVSLAMISSKGLRTEDRIILRRMRFEKGGVVDLAQEDKKRGKYRIRKVSRSPGIKKNFYRTNPKYREQAARYIQSWWKEMKELYSKKIQKIIKIQSVYRGRFVRKYLYDLLYLNYLYLSFCQKIEKVLKQQIKPYVFNILKKFCKSKDVSQEEKDYNILKNIVASKAKKWKILNLRKYFKKWERFLRNKERLTLIIYKLLKLRVENQNKNNILRDNLRKWYYITKTLNMVQTFEEEKKTIIKKTEIKYEEGNDEDEQRKIKIAKDEHTNKIKGLFRLLDGINKYTKKSAMEPTLPKLIYYLSNEHLNRLLKKIINRKTVDENEKLKHYFYKYIQMTLKYIKNRINELPLKVEKEFIEDIELKGQPESKSVTKIKTITINTEDIKRKQEIEKLENLLKENEKKKQNEMLLMKARIFLHLIKCIKDKQNKNILRKYFTKYFKKVIQLQREEDRKLFDEREKREKEKRDKEREDERLRSIEREKERQLEIEKYRKIEREMIEEKDKNKQINNEKEKDEKDIEEYMKIIEKYKMIISEKEEEDLNKQVDTKEIYKKLNKELLDKLRACEILNRYVLRRTHKYPLDAFKDKLSD